MRIVIATRRSRLALAQSRWVAGRLQVLAPDAEIELLEIVTRGDRIQDVPLPEVGGKGLFTLEIEEALLSGRAHLAVHSLKDLPGDLPAGLCLAAVPEREDPHDALVLPASASPPLDLGGCAGSRNAELSGLPAPLGARVGTSSLRRAAQLRALRPDLCVESVRGNVDTRLRKLDEGQYDALVLAAAGLRRLGLGRRIACLLPPEVCVPAPGQGALGLEARSGDTATLDLLSGLQCEQTSRCVSAERSVMRRLGAGCSVPLGAYAVVEAGDRLALHAALAAPDGSRCLRCRVEGPASDPEAPAADAVEELLRLGAREILG